jgi:two-component system response regulator AlgR
LVALRTVRALAERVGEGEDGWAVHIAAVDEWVSVSRRQLSAVREALAAD